MTQQSSTSLKEIDRQHLFHSFTALKSFDSTGPTLTVVSGSGSTLKDSQGDTYLAAMAGLWCVIADFGIDAYWLSREPWIGPEPSCRKRAERGHSGTSTIELKCSPTWSTRLEDPALVKTSPHNQVVARANTAGLDDSERWKQRGGPTSENW